MRIKFFAAIAFSFCIALPAWGQGTPKFKSILNAEINSSFPDNTTGAITPAIVRGVFNDFVASWQQFSGVNAQVGTTYNIVASDYGQLITLNNVAAVSVIAPTPTGTFQYFNFYIRGVGAGTATLTVTGGTINGNASLSIPQSSSYWLVSDQTGTNYIAMSLTGATPGGLDTQVQFNSSGAFGASANLTWVSPALTIGVASSTTGILKQTGSSGGTVTITPQATAGSPTITWPNASGTVAVSASSPIVLSATTGNLTCPTCATSSGGGAVTGTSPITVSAAGVVSLDDAGVTYAKIQNLGALAIMGRSANSSGVGADIQATAASGAVLRESGSTIGFGTIATAGIANNAVTLAKLATQATNTVLANATSGTAVPTALAVSSCSTAASALIWTTNTGFGCNTSITAAAVPASGLTGTTLAASVVTSSLTTVGALAGGSATTGFTINAGSVTWSGQIPGANVVPVANASGSPSATFGVMKADGTTIQCTTGVCSAVGGVATSVQIGVTTVTSGTTTRVLFDNAGTLGEYVITGTGNVVMSASPTLTGTITAAAASFSGTVNHSGAFQISGNAMTFPGAAATITQTIASGAKALATGAIGSAACTSAQTDTATGTATTDAIVATFNGDPTAVTGYVPLTSGMLTIIAYPTVNTVNFKVCNNTTSSITPGAITLNWRVVR